MAVKYINSETNQEKSISFPWYWVFTPLCAIELISKGQFVRGVLGIIPLFTIIWMLKYQTILGASLEKRGFKRVN